VSKRNPACNTSCICKNTAAVFPRGCAVSTTDFGIETITGTSPMIDTMNWSMGVDSKGQPIPNPAKEATTDGVLVSPNSGGATNWPSPSFDPETGLFYVGTSETFSVFYLTDTDPHPEGYGAVQVGAGSYGGALRAIDYKTGKTVWQHHYPSGGGATGILTTAGKTTP
jgi:glucose dehydrogenase